MEFDPSLTLCRYKRLRFQIVVKFLQALKRAKYEILHGAWSDAAYMSGLYWEADL